MVCQIISFFKHEQNIEMVYCSPEGEIKEVLYEKKILYFPVKKVCIKEIKRAILELKPDVIHAHDMKASFVVSNTHGKIPYICHIHNNAFDSRKITPKAIAFMLAARKARHIFWVSDSAKNGYVFKRAVEQKSSILYNIIDITEVKKKCECDNRMFKYDVIYLGRLSKEKNPLRLISIFQKVIQKNNGITLGMVGSGPLENEVQRMIINFGLEKNVFLIGFQKNPMKILYSSKVMAMTSLWEGLPMCALEAQALGKPIVSTPTDGLKILIKNDETGYLSDDDDEFAQMLFNIVTNDELRGYMSRKAFEQSVVFNDITNYCNSLLKQYRG